MRPRPLQQHRIRSTLLFQFPELDIDNILGDTDIIISGKTKRIRSVFDVSGEKILLFSLRTSDGRFLPTFEAGKRIIQSGYEGNRITMSEDASPFVASGKSAFCKHVLQVDDNIFPGSEVFLLDPGENLLAVGTALHPGYAMLDLENGPAAKVKHYNK